MLDRYVNDEFRAADRDISNSKCTSYHRNSIKCLSRNYCHKIKPGAVFNCFHVNHPD